MEELAQVVLIAGAVATALGAMGRLLLAVFRVAKNAEAAAAAPARLDELEPIVAQNAEQRERTIHALRRLGDEVTVISEEFSGLENLERDVARLKKQQDSWEQTVGKFFEKTDERLEELRDLICNGGESRDREDAAT